MNVQSFLFRLTRGRARYGFYTFLAVMLVFAYGSKPAWATATTAGTSISNTSTASYSDANASAFAVTSNTVSTTVQNAPTMTTTSPSNQNVTPGEIVVDTFTLTNTGNNSGNFELPSAASNAGNATVTLKGYVIGGDATCTTAAPCTLANVQTELAVAGNTIATGGTLTLGVEYQVTSSTYAQTVQYSISTDLAYPVTSGAAAATSASSSSTAITDTVQSDARLDLQASASTPTSSGANITWTVTGNNGGNYAAQDLTAVGNLLGTNGVAIFVKLPIFSSSTLALQSNPSVATCPAGVTCTVYYNTGSNASAPTTGWSSTAPGTLSTTTWIAVLLHGGASSVELASAPSGSTGAGAVSTPQVSFSFVTAQPTGTGATTSGSVTNMANADIGGHTWATGAIPVIGPGISTGTADSGSQSLAATEGNTTPGSSTTWPGGASNQSSSQEYGMSVLNGPLDTSSATGSCPVSGGSCQTTGGSGAATNNLDFTALGFACSGGSSINGGTCGVPSGGVNIPNTVTNTGNLTDTITLTATPPAGWTVQLFLGPNCPGTAPSTLSNTTCGTLGAQITNQSSAGTAISGTVSLAAGASQNYVAVYKNASAVSPFVGVDATVVATGTTSETNTTHNDLYAGGVIELTNAVAVNKDNCPSGVTVTSVCPGGTLQYTITYQNVAPAGSTGANAGTEPAFALTALQVNSSGITITDDGTTTWGVNTFGIDGATVAGSTSAAPAGSDAGNTTIHTYLCTPTCGTADATANASGSYPSVSTGPNKLTAAIAAASSTLAPGGSGTVVYYVTVK